MPSFRSEKFIFIHFPKTAGMWFWSVCNRLGVPILEQGPHMASHKTAAYFDHWDKLPWIVIYRNPMDWYTSLYNYHVKMDWYWRPQRKDISFHQFVEVSLMTKPYSHGWYEMVVEPKQRRKHSTGELQWFPPTYMVQYENMYEELELIMRDKFGYHLFTKERLGWLKKRNARNIRGHRGGVLHSHCPALTPKLRQKILEVDKPIFDLYERHDAIVAEW